MPLLSHPCGQNQQMIDIERNTITLKVIQEAHLGQSILSSFLTRGSFLQRVQTTSRLVIWAAGHKFYGCPLAPKLHLWIQLGSTKPHIGKKKSKLIYNVSGTSKYTFNGPLLVDVVQCILILLQPLACLKVIYDLRKGS